MHMPSNISGDAEQLAQTCAALKQQLAQRRAAFFARSDAGDLMTPVAAQLEFEAGVQDAVRRYFGESLEASAGASTAESDAPLWLVSLQGPSDRIAQVLVCSMGSENDVREVARVHMGRGWSTQTADRTSQRGRAGYVARASLPAAPRATSVSAASDRPMSLGEQVRQAQAVVAGWSPEKRASVQLEGDDFRAAPTDKRRRGARP